MTVAVLIPIRTVSEMNMRQHWWLRAKRVKLQRLVVGAVCRSSLQRPDLPCSILLTRVSTRSLDTDNLQSALKATRDAVAEWLGIDDADPRVSWLYAQEKAKKPYGVRVEVIA